MIEPVLVKNFYSSDMIALMQKQMDVLKREAKFQDNDRFHRLEYHNHPLFKALHELQIQKAKDLFQADIKPTYCFASMYFEGEGYCPKHTDRPQCKYTVDLCVNQVKPWSFFAECGDRQYEFLMEPGDAILLSGTDHPHWRDKIQPDNFCDLVFFHYVDQDFQGEMN